MALFQVSAGMVETVAFTFGAVTFGAVGLAWASGGSEEDACREREREQACREASHTSAIAPFEGF